MVVKPGSASLCNLKTKTGIQRPAGLLTCQALRRGLSVRALRVVCPIVFVVAVNINQIHLHRAPHKEQQLVVCVLLLPRRRRDPTHVDPALKAAANEKIPKPFHVYTTISQKVFHEVVNQPLSIIRIILLVPKSVLSQQSAAAIMEKALSVLGHLQFIQLFCNACLL